MTTWVVEFTRLARLEIVFKIHNLNEKNKSNDFLMQETYFESQILKLIDKIQ